MFNRLLDPEGSKLPRLCDLGPEIAPEVQRLGALPLPELATEVMTKAFTPDYEPGSGAKEVGAIADHFMPEYGSMRMGDTNPPEWFALCDLLAEGVQLLEHARLVRPKMWLSGSVASYGWTTTRAGRAALSAGSVESMLDGAAS
jgi:hypothetical protein